MTTPTLAERLDDIDDFLARGGYGPGTEERVTIAEAIAAVTRQPDTWRQHAAFAVMGLPKPQGSHIPIRSKSTGKLLVIEDAGPPLRAWRKTIAATARTVLAGMTLDGPVAVRLIFTLPRPASGPNADIGIRPFPTTTPDIDKLARAVLDSLTTAKAYRDDAQVVQLVASKLYATRTDPPGVRVRILIPTQGD